MRPSQPPLHASQLAERLNPMAHQVSLKIHFSDYFHVDPAALKSVGAFNVSLINDLPLFIDPFLLFNSREPTYRQLHDEIIRYLRFLRDKSVAGPVTPGLLAAWYTFSEIKQTWLGFSQIGNQGRGLGVDFARSLHASLHSVFSQFGSEKVTKGSHLEKLCLVHEGVGRDNISDFTTNLIKSFLLEYTQAFATAHIAPPQRRRGPVARVRFNYDTETWESDVYELPVFEGDYVLLTPKDILTKDDTWINRTDLIKDFDEVLHALPNQQLRDQLNNYLLKHLPKRPTPSERRTAIAATIRNYPEFIEFYIRYKEDHGDRAESISKQRVAETEALFIEQVRRFAESLANQTNFYAIPGNTRDEARERILFLKDVIENKGGHRLFYLDGEPVRRESDLHILFRLTWFATPSDVSREVNDGRGPADFKISRGSLDKSIVEFKLASNTSLRGNLERQVEMYKRASDAQHGLKVIVYFTQEELERVTAILRDLRLAGDPNIVLIDARRDNKPSASKA